MVVHVDNTTSPKTPALPKYLKAYMYLPLNLVSEFMDSHLPIAKLVQSLIETISIHTVSRWRQAAIGLDWSLTQAGHWSLPGTADLLLIPDPVSSTSSHYIFLGRPYGSLTATLPNSNIQVTSSSASPCPGLTSDQPAATDEPESNKESHQVNQSTYVAPANDTWYELVKEAQGLRMQLVQAQMREAELEVVIVGLQDEVQVAISRRCGGNEWDTNSSHLLPATFYSNSPA